MKSQRVLALAAGWALALASGSILAAEPPTPFIYETPTELFGSGDFTGSGRLDLVIVDKLSGKYRLGYQAADGVFSWVDCRPSGMKGITGLTIGKLFNGQRDALCFASPAANAITMVDVSSDKEPSRPVTVPFTDALGPNTVVALNGARSPGQADLLYVGTIYNSPDPNQETLLRNDGKEFPKVSDLPLSGAAMRGNRLSLKNGEPELLGVLVHAANGDRFQLGDFSPGKPAFVTMAPRLGTVSDYAVGNLGLEDSNVDRQFVFYEPGETHLLVSSVNWGLPGHPTFGPYHRIDLPERVKRVITLEGTPRQKLLVIFADGERAGVFGIAPSGGPKPLQTIIATNEQFTCAASLPGLFLLFSQPIGGKFSTRYYVYTGSNAPYAPTAFGTLASLADNDNITIPDIHDRIVRNLEAKTEGEMKPYTNAIPGTQVTYAMVPIPGSEFVMGSPEAEKGRKPDEGPQHKVTISPFWMGRCEVTWNEYELFMYPDEEHRVRMTQQTDEAGDKLADAITHPSKPYVEMSFGMGKDNYPAISMTQHAANKYCQWLSAKTGQFYRLPTEAEWEYAARAGTTTTYFFGDDTNQLSQYAWFEDNSDFKYQKVGKKKPNPWGLYDIYGNVTEWVLDQYDPDFYKQCASKGELTDPWNKATKAYPHSVRGGSWDDEAVKCRSAARRGSDRSWKMQDPQLPKSVWYFSDAQFVGFRIIRPLKVPPPEEMQKYWTSGVEKD
jgi:formylglycine-generating enzyme required for sulfatase activity